MKRTFNQIVNEITDLISIMRTYINNEGGNLEFVNFIDGVVTIRISGKCLNCSMRNITFDEGVKTALISEIKEVNDVKFIK